MPITTQYASKWFPLEDAPYSLLGFASPIGIGGKGVGELLGRVLRTTKNLFPVKRAATVAKTAKPVGDPIPVTAYLDDMLQTTMPSQTGSAKVAIPQNLSNISGATDRTATWDALKKLGWKKWLLDVPVTPRANEPLVIRSEARVGNLARQLFPDNTRLRRLTSSGEMVNPRGLYDKPSNIAVYSTESQLETLPHELFHWARYVTPETRQPQLRNALANMATKHQKAITKIREASPEYKKLQDWQIGEELIARLMDRPQFAQDPHIRGAVKRAWNAVQPEMYLDAQRIPVEIPISAISGQLMP